MGLLQFGRDHHVSKKDWWGAWPLWPWPRRPTWCCRWSCAPRWRAAGRGARPGPGLQTLQPRSDRGHCQQMSTWTLWRTLTLELLSSRNRTSSSSLILRIVLICFLMKAHSMVQPLYGGCVRCCVLQSGDCGPMVRGWEDGGGLGWARLYTASTHPARHGLMVPLQLRRSASRCLAFLYANDCKLTLSLQPECS